MLEKRNWVQRRELLYAGSLCMVSISAQITVESHMINRTCYYWLSIFKIEFYIVWSTIFLFIYLLTYTLWFNHVVCGVWAVKPSLWWGVSEFYPTIRGAVIECFPAYVNEPYQVLYVGTASKIYSCFMKTNYV